MALTKTVSLPCFFSLMLTSLYKAGSLYKINLEAQPSVFFHAHTSRQIEYPFNNLKQWVSV